jgi:acyl-CoA synthetase (AMP-forming)/AMP-acid ligase II
VTGWPHLAIGDWVTMHARYPPGAECLVRGDGSALTYREVESQVTRLARALAAAGLKRGDRIGIMATGSPEYVCLQLASMKLGTTFVALNFRLSAPEATNLLQASEISALFISERYRSIVAPVPDSLGGQVKLVASFEWPDARWCWRLHRHWRRQHHQPNVLLAELRRANRRNF